MPTANKIRSALAGAARRRNRSAPVPADPALRRLRAALTAFFCLDGFLFAGWVVRIPAIKAQTGASPGALGLALLGVSAGGVITMMLAGRLCRRLGSHTVTVACGVLLSLSLTLPPLTRSAPALGLVLLVFGGAYGALNVSMNAAAVDLVAALRRPVMPSFHAAFSLGGMLGAGVGGPLADHLSPARHLTLLAALGVAGTACAGPALWAHAGRLGAAARGSGTDGADGTDGTDGTDSADGTDGADRPGRASAARARRLVLVCGLIALCTAYGEGALADWSALHLTADLHASPGVAAAGYSVFALAMTAGRLSGTALLERFGPTRALAAGGLAASAGMLAAALAPAVWLVLAGFAVTGLGLANIFPVAIGRAGALAGPGGVAAASTLGYGGMVLGPVAIGFLAEWLSLPVALTTVAALAAVAALVAWTTRRAVLAESGHGSR